MGFYYRRRVRLTPGMWLNLSKSGVSLSSRVGRTTVNSRGSLFVRLARGLSWRGRL